jgi:hypothetical protein
LPVPSGFSTANAIHTPERSRERAAVSAAGGDAGGAEQALASANVARAARLA